MTAVVQLVEVQCGHFPTGAMVVLCCQLLDPGEDAVEAVAQVIDDHHVVTGFEKLERGVRSYEAETADDENEATLNSREDWC